MAESLVDIPNIKREDLHSSLKAISTSGRRLQSLVENILDFSNLRNQKIILSLEPVHIQPLIEERIQEMRPLAASKNILLEFLSNKPVKPVYADPIRLKQIITQLLDNAIKFTEHGNVTVTTATSEDHVSVIIRDTGIGMNEELMVRMFHLFEQGDMTADRKYSGTGLGLALVKELTELHEGTISCESEPGKGTTMTLTFPCAQ